MVTKGITSIASKERNETRKESKELSSKQVRRTVKYLPREKDIALRNRELG